MKFCKNGIFQLFCLIVCLGFLQGCDQTQALMEYFGAKPEAKKAASSTTLPPQETRPSSPEAAPSPQAGLPENVLARVGEWTITKEEFEERLGALKEIAPEFDVQDPEQKALILEELLRQQLLVQEAERRGISGREDIVQAVEELRRTLLIREVAAQATEGIVATEEEAKEYYEQNRVDFAEPAQWRVREIVVSTEEEAKQILIELYQGADFAQMAEARSQAESASKQGDMGYLSVFDFPKRESVVAALEEGDVSGVFQGPGGFYIVKLEEKAGASKKILKTSKKISKRD